MKDRKIKKEEKTLDSGISEIEQKIADLTIALQRNQADFQNYRRQSEMDKQRLIKLANEDLMMEILPVLDNFQLAAKHVPAELEANNWTIGIKQIEKQLENILENEGLHRIETIGTQFDPKSHEAIEHIESDKPENEIVEEILSGYAFGDEVIRPAKVKVSSGK
jgi:molecular chaperone GrpE